MSAGVGDCACGDGTTEWIGNHAIGLVSRRYGDYESMRT